jgi:hypothetical protein
MFLASLLGVLVQFLGSSTFASGLHMLLTELGATSKESDLDQAAEAAVSLLNSGMAFEHVISSLMGDFGLEMHHASLVASVARAKQTKGTP